MFKFSSFVPFFLIFFFLAGVRACMWLSPCVRVDEVKEWVYGLLIFLTLVSLASFNAPDGPSQEKMLLVRNDDDYSKNILTWLLHVWQYIHNNQH